MASKAVKVRVPRLRNDYGLTAAQETFATALAAGKSMAEAYREAYPKSREWKPQTLHKRASEAVNGEVLGRVRVLMAAAAEANEVKVSDVLRHYLDVARADPNELVSIVRHCCRYCHGMGHRYQWTPAQLQAAQERADASGGKIPSPDATGGTGYDQSKKPAPECPECNGLGEADVVLRDTTALSPKGRALYAGAKQGPRGIEVVMHSQMEAWQAIARHVGFFERDNTAPESVGMDVEALQRKFGATMERVMERHAAMLKDREGLMR